MTPAPLRRAVIVDAPPETAFAVFTDDIGTWWPVDGHSVFGAGGSVSMADGDIVEVSATGATAHWGSITAWEPPYRVAFTWHAGRPADAPSSQVEVRFTDLDGQTLVLLEHSGWEAHADPESARSEYGNGWPRVLSQFVDAIAPDHIFVALQHRPGPAADPGAPLFSQPGFAEHLAFISRQHEQGHVLAAGPLPESEGQGMTVLRLPAENGLAEATRLATEDDRSVASGFLTVEVRPWQVVAQG